MVHESGCHRPYEETLTRLVHYLNVTPFAPNYQ